MADAKTQTKEDKKKTASSKKGGGKLIFLMILVGCLIPFGLPTLFVCVGLTPTLIAMFTDRDAHKSGFATIGYMNFAGVLPFLIELWRGGQTMDLAVRIMGDPFTWVVMLGAAGVGHLILYAVPPAISSLVINKHQARLIKLREALKQLESVWGPEVSSGAPLDSIRRKMGLE